jgi:hypothetical protein
MDADSFGGDLQATLGVFLGVDDQVTEPFSQGHEVTFGIDDGLLHPGDALFEQSTQQVGFARAGIALHQQARREKFLEVQSRGVTRCGASYLDSNGHFPTQISLGGDAFINLTASGRAVGLGKQWKVDNWGQNETSVLFAPKQVSPHGKWLRS